MSNRIKDIIDGLPPRKDQPFDQCIEMIYDKITEAKGKKFTVNDKEVTYINLYVNGTLKKKKRKNKSAKKNKWIINIFSKQ